MEPAEENYVRLEFLVPTRGLIGYRSNFITNTKGEGIIVRSFDSYKPYAGEITGRKMEYWFLWKAVKHLDMHYIICLTEEL